MKRLNDLQIDATLTVSHFRVCTLIVHCVKVWHWMIKRLFSTPHFNLNVLSVAFVKSLLVDA